LILNLVSRDSQPKSVFSRLKPEEESNLKPMRRLILPTLALATVLLLATSFAFTYTVKAGDTLYSIARSFRTTVAELERLNNLSSSAVKIGQVLTVPTVTTSSPAPSLTPGTREARFQGQTQAKVIHRLKAIPGDPVTVRVLGAKGGAPIVTWGPQRNDGTFEELVMTPDGNDWVGVGRELLGEKPKTVNLETNIGVEAITSSVKLLRDPQSIQNVFVSQQVLSTVTDVTRERELAVLNPAYKQSELTPRAWFKTWAQPINSAHISPFGQARRYERGGDVKYHYGEDFAGKVGDPIRAANDGTVVIAGFYTIRGGLTGIDHGAGIVSLYFHQSKIGVTIGQKVARGEIIGAVGATGFVTGPHLHWEMRVRGEATDPKQWLGKIFP
jgi:murein DD-endopeptidase MepM/ murein hydrolase activator NlpD